ALACGRTLTNHKAETLVRSYLNPYKAQHLVFKSIGKKSFPSIGEGYVINAQFSIPYKGRLIDAGVLPFYITYNEKHHGYEINPDLTASTRQSIDMLVGMRQINHQLKSHPYNPEPWREHKP
ncbi:MAG: hypothetical protein P8018_09990, partial [Acidobacteriota bacterium]